MCLKDSDRLCYPTLGFVCHSVMCLFSGEPYIAAREVFLAREKQVFLVAFPRGVACSHTLLSAASTTR